MRAIPAPVGGQHGMWRNQPPGMSGQIHQDIELVRAEREVLSAQSGGTLSKVDVEVTGVDDTGGAQILL